MKVKVFLMTLIMAFAVSMASAQTEKTTQCDKNRKECCQKECNKKECSKECGKKECPKECKKECCKKECTEKKECCKKGKK
ncbi:hypothetical protein LJB85_00110 [Porphyromonadaceae bacterium OttesenSCG-928-L07]|nr:hypothetical protein [Porphyromonadaceae bacterium OttesenSCG-928-L07]MDL2330979.1 hypothetical protein [Odoribacter sp. OttesenSCG-928-A06]